MTKSKLLSIGIACMLLLFGFTILLTVSSGSTQGTNSSGEPLQVACVGDSITEGSGYPADLQAILGQNYTVYNFGVTGSTVLWKSDKPYAAQTTFLDAKTCLPNIVIIMLGTNDANTQTYGHIDDFTDNYMRLVNQFRALRSDPQIFLVDPPPIFNNTLDLNNTNLVQGIIPRIDKAAIQLNLPTINMYNALFEHPEFFGDGVHPTSQGASLIATEVATAITSENIAGTT